MYPREFRFLDHRFDLPGTIKDISPLGSGHIHDTYLITCTDQEHSRFVLQKFNQEVFRNPLEVMSNIDKVLEQIDKNQSKSFEPLRIIKTLDGDLIHLEQSHFYRIYNYIGNSDSFDQVTTIDQAIGGARAFGEFLELLGGVSPSELYTTIPDFHNLNTRFSQLKQAVAEDMAGRLKDFGSEVEFALARESKVLECSSLLENPNVPFRVTHNDTKINNVLFKQESTTAICVVDLDTIMPGLLLFDFGDMARTFCNAVLEEGNSEEAFFRLEIFEGVCQGFFQSITSSLPKPEVESLKIGPWWMTYIMAIRFLADFLNGDVYYKINSPLQNLDRARNQLNLVKDIEEKQDQINHILETQAIKFGHW